MIVQHPLLWCAVLLAAGITIGLSHSLLFCLPLLAVSVIACTFLCKSRHLHDVLTLLVWFLLGCSRAAVGPVFDMKPGLQQIIEQKAKHVQDTLVDRLETAGLSPRTLTLCSALTVGKKDGLKRETRQAYNKVGAGHLLALSGMHLGIIYAFLYLILIRGVRHTRYRWFSLPAVLLCLWGYALVAGMPVSLVRAALMLSIFSILSLMQYDTDPLHALALSAIIILLIAPTDLLSISFQLSFAAVFFLLALWVPLRENFPKLSWMVRILAVSCVATVGTMPITLYYFHQISLLGPFLSLVLIPLTTVIIYLTLTTMLLPVAPLGWTLNNAEALQQRIIDLAGSVPHTTLTCIYPSAWVIALMYGAMLLAVIRLRTSTTNPMPIR